MNKFFRIAAFTVFILSFFFLSSQQTMAKPIGADAPCRGCCNQTLPDIPSGSGPCPDLNGGSFLSYSHGTMGESYPVVSVQSANGAGLDLTLHYTSYAADGEKASLSTVMGFGWSHSYNIFLFQQSRDIFKMSPAGLATKYKRAGRAGSLSATRGHQQTIVENPDGSIEVRNKDGLTYLFEKITDNPLRVSGVEPWMLTRITDRIGYETKLIYQNGLLAEVEDTYGKKINFKYDASHRLVKITDPLDRITELSYDAYNNLASIKDPLSQTASYTYNERHQIVSKTDKNGNKWQYEYDATGHPVGILDGNGDVVFRLTNGTGWATNLYDLFRYKQRTYVPSVTTRTDGRGKKWEYHYNKDGLLTKVVTPDNCITSYEYDPITLNLASETDCNGNTTSYEYDAKGNRTKVTDALGNVTTYEYEPLFNYVTKITSYAGSTTLHSITEYEYDAKGNRTRETRDVGGLDLVRESAYYTNGNVHTEKDPNGHVTTYEYDAYGNLTKVMDPEGKVTEYKYDKTGTPGYEMLGNRTKVIDANTHETRYEYDDLDRLIKETDALGYTTEYKYDGEDNRIKITKQVTKAPDPLTFQVTQSEYDIRNRLFREIVDPGGLNLLTEYGYDKNDKRILLIDPRGKTTTFQYDAQNRLILTTDALGNSTATRYDCVGNRTCAIDANGHYTFYEYDPLNRLIKETRKMGTQECTPADADDIVTQYFYNNGGGGAPGCCGATPGSGNISKIIDPEGKVTYFKYDKVDRRWVTNKKVGDTADLIDGNDWVESAGYDPAGNVLSRTDANNNATTFTHYDNNWPKTEANALSETTTYTYDSVGNVKTVTGAGGNVTTNTYNERNELTEVTDSIGLVSSYIYDGVGNRKTEADGSGNGSSYEYDAVNRLIATTDAMGETTCNQYDNAGNLIKTTDREGHVVCYQYDDINRRTLMVQKIGDTDCDNIDEDDIQTATEYDNVGNVTRLTDSNGNTTDYVYDEVNRLIKETYVDTGKREFTYDDAGNMLTRKDQKNQITTYTYNDLYYLSMRDYPVGPDDTFTYDTCGRMLTAERNGWIVTFTYDDANKVTQTTQNGQAISYGYDIPNRRRTITYPGGRVITEQMDLRKRLDKIDDADSPPPIVQYTYDLGNKVDTRTYRNGVVADYDYNANNWITDLEHTFGAIRIAGFGHDYDKEGNKKYEENHHDTDRSEAYQYDDIYRLIDYKVGELVGSTISIPVTQTQYKLDELGNWDSKVTDGVTENHEHNLVNEITAIDGVPIIHDDNGNLQEDEDYTYIYDEENRLISVTCKSDSQVVGQYQYDALTRRVVKLANSAGSSTETRYFYDDARVIEAQDENSVTQAKYVYGNYVDEVLTMDRGGQTYYYHQNTLWSVAAVTNSAANVVEHYTYDAYGCVTITDGAGNPVPPNAWGTPHSAIGNPYAFTGRRMDEETGLYYYRARFYDSVKGRFVQRDESTFQEELTHRLLPAYPTRGFNLYEYTDSNPINSVDPSGNIKWFTAKRVSKEKVYPWKKQGRKTYGPVGDNYEVKTDAGNSIIVWKPHRNQAEHHRYWCHGLTFGGKRAPGGPFSPYTGPSVQQIIKDEWDELWCCNIAKKGDIIVWSGTRHSAILTKVAVKGSKIDENNSRLDTKNGMEPEKKLSLKQINATYGNKYTCYTKKT